MKRLLRLSKAAIIGGALVVLPVVLTLLVITQAWALARRLLDRLPVYGEIRAVAHSVAGMKGSRYRSVLVDINGVDAWTPALLIEPEEDGRATVYVPAAPAVSLGFVHIVPATRVRLSGAGLARVAGVVRQFGAGAQTLAAEACDALAGGAGLRGQVPPGGTHADPDLFEAGLAPRPHASDAPGRW